MTPRIRMVRDEKGVALPLALFALVMLSGLLLTFLSMSGTETLIARNHLSASRAFYIADAGIEHAWAVLPSSNIPTDPKLLLNGWTLLPVTQFHDASYTGTYTVTASQNPDGTYNLTSTATQGNSTRIIRAVVSAGAPPAPRAAGEVLIGPGGSYEAHADPGGSFDGRDWIAPANIGACTDIASCGTKVSDTGTFGAFANSNSQSFEITGGGTMYGKTMSGADCLVYACASNSAIASHDNNASVLLTRWDSFINAAIAQASQPPLPGTVLQASNTVQWGTAAAPQITVIKNDANVSWTTKVNGAGVLIIDSLGSTNPSQNLKFANGELNWEGLVIIRSAGEVQFEVESNPNGRVRVFGQVVNRSAVRAEIELNKPNNFIKYSSAAIRNATRNLSSFRSWQEL